MGCFNKTAILKQADAIAGSLLCRLMGWWDCSRRGGRPVLDPPPTEVKRLLIVRPGGIGDMVILIPLLRWLRERYPDAELDLACEKRNGSVAELAGLDAHVMVYDAHPLAFLHRLRSGRYDLAIDTEQFHNFSAIFAWLSGARTRIGFKINPRRNALYTHLVDYAVDGPEAAQFERLLAPLGGQGTCVSRVGCLDSVDVALPVGLEAEVKQTLGERPFVVTHLGSSSAYKQWPAERYAETLRQLHETDGLGAVLIGGRQDGSCTDRVMSLLKEAGVPCCSAVGRLTLRQSAAMVSRGALFLGPDSGMAHLAVAFDVPSVVLFGPSDPRKWGERSSRQAVVNVSLPCSPCFIFGYARPCWSFDCMQKVTSEAVLASCRVVLGPVRG